MRRRDFGRPLGDGCAARGADRAGWGLGGGGGGGGWGGGWGGWGRLGVGRAGRWWCVGRGWRRAGSGRVGAVVCRAQGWPRWVGGCGHRRGSRRPGGVLPGGGGRVGLVGMARRR